ncbi:MAG: hypothetical protein V1872_06175 [bacterium]
MSPHCNHLNNKAFTLLEVLFALGIFSYGLLAILGLLLVGIKGNGISKNQTTAIFLAEAMMEEIKKAGYGNTTNGSDTINSIGIADSIFKRSWDIDSSYGASTEKITVSVSWQDIDRNHTITLETLLSERNDKR